MFCTYSMEGQPIVLDEGSRLAVVTCPECGRTQPVGPILRGIKASRRRAALFTYGWVCTVLLTVFGSIGVIAGLAQSTGFAVSVPLARFIALFYADAQAGDAQPTIREPMQWNVIGLDWWENEGREAVMGTLAWNRLADAVVLTDLLWLLLICPPLALLWRAIFSRSSRTTIMSWFVLGVVVGAVGLYGYLSAQPQGVKYHDRGNYAIYLAEAEVGVYVLWGSYAVGLIVLALFIWAAGPALRHVARTIGGVRARALSGQTRLTP